MILNVESVDALQKQPTTHESVRTTSVISRTFCNRSNIRHTNETLNPAELDNLNFLPQSPINNFDSCISQEDCAMDLNDPKTLLQNANIICMNCSSLHSDFRAFENHECHVRFTNGDQNEQMQGVNGTDKGKTFSIHITTRRFSYTVVKYFMQKGKSQWITHNEF